MVNGYYETVFADMVNEGCLSFTPVFFDAKRWYEIDTISDLRAAEKVCDLYHQTATVKIGRARKNRKVPSYPPAFTHLKDIGRIPMGTCRLPVIEASALMMSALTVAPVIH
jgi:hypothetical protein